MAQNNEKTLAMHFGPRPHAVVRLRGWERYAWVLWELCVAVIGVVSVANLLGAGIPSSVTHTGEIAAGALTIVAVTGIFRAMNRYDGELEDTPPRVAGPEPRLRTSRAGGVNGWPARP